MKDSGVMFDLIEANESTIVESQGLRADLYEIMGIDYDGRDDYYTLDIRTRRGSEAEGWAIKWLEAELTGAELLEMTQGVGL